MNYLQILFLLLAASTLAAWLNPKWLRLLFAVLTAFLVCLQISAVYLTGELINNRFLQHLGIDQLQDYGFQFKTEIMLFIVAWLLLSLLIYFVTFWIRHKNFKTWVKLSVLAVSLVLMALPGGMLLPLWQRIQIAQANSENLDQALADLGIEPETYIKPHQVKATAGKNIIVISLESIEQGFLDPPLNQLMPNLTALTHEWTFFNQMPVITGSDWTAGSLYTQQTGLPALFNQQHFDNNNLFQHSQDFQLTTLNHVLQTAGYQTKYLIGKPEFAGIASILATLGMEVVSEQNSIGRYPPAEPGLHDKDLFSEAKLQIADMQANSDQPFALFMSTINTHFPNGILDRRMLHIAPENKDALQTMVAATDYLLQEFIDSLAQLQLLENTVIYVFPDHALMGNSGASHRILKQQERQLYLLSSADSAAFTRPTNEPIFQTDLPKLILEGAEVKTNAQFLTDFINDRNTPQFIDQNIIKIAAINNAALSRKQFNQGLDLSFDNQQLTIASAKQQISTAIRMRRPTEVYEVVFNPQMVPLQQQQISLNEAYINDHIDPRLKLLYLHSYIQNNAIDKVVLSNRNGIEINKPGPEFQFSTAEINGLIQQVDMQISQLKPIKKPPLSLYSTDQQRFIAHAGGAIDGHTYTNSLEALNHNYQAGFRLFELDIQQTADGHFVAVHDWPQWQKQTNFQGDLPPSLKTFKQQKIFSKYHALDMPAINSWFTEHSDAILVTDKVNQPQAFAAQFIDSRRLMMELFTWSAVKQAKQLDLSAVIPSGDLILKTPGDKLSYLQDLEVEYLAVSRRWVDNNPNLLRALKQAGLKIFAFHIGFDKGKDEEHLVCHERQYFYGLYADNWTFQRPDNCQ